MKIKHFFPSIKSALLLLAALTFTLVLTGQAKAEETVEEGSLVNFRAVRTYEEDHFDDIPADAWYASGVAKAYELGLLSGKSERHFDPEGELTTVEAVVIAARLHSVYYTGNDVFTAGRVWYESYVRYALDNGILDSRYNIKAPATRARFAGILSRALPDEALPEIRTVLDGAIPDVSPDDKNAAGIYLFYRAGILSGSNTRGGFNPDGTITRAEAAAIVTRMTDPDQRQGLTLTYTGPEVPEQPKADEAFFANSAILGNSLVDGLRLYSGLKTLHYFCGTGVSVTSALNAGGGESLVQAMCREKRDRIYIELGINEIGYDADTLAALYGALLDTIITAQPEAEIYVISILPVTAAKSASGIFNMERVNAYNEVLYRLAAEKQCWYLDVCSALTGDDGYLPGAWSWDGVHLQPAYYSVWEDYMRTHYLA